MTTGDHTLDDPILEAVGAHLRAQWPTTRQLALHALADGGHVDDLSAEEAAEVEQEWDRMEAVLEESPGLAAVAQQIVSDREEFMAGWPQPMRLVVSRVWRVAASVALVGIALTLSLVLQRGDSQTIVAIADGMVQFTELPDGSTVHLVGPAELRYDEESFARAVDLTGRGFLDVVLGEDPFTVSTPEALISVLGTTFGVTAEGNATEVVLESGRVSVASHDGDTVELRPGQMTRVIQGSAPDAVVEVDLATALSWTPFVIFRDTPLENAALALETRFGISVSVDARLLGESVTAAFEPETELETILRALALTVDAEVVEEGDGYQIVASP